MSPEAGIEPRACRMSESRQMKRTIGLWGAVATLVGYVIGASVFILPGELAPATGPAVFVSYLLASIPALLACFVTAQIGCAYPVSGAAYVAASRVLSPYWGFMVVWSLLMGVTVGVALIAYGFADYLAFFFPGLDRRAVAIVTVLAFCIINVLGARLSVGSEAVMVVGFMTVLAVFGVGGVWHMEPAHLTPLFPKGLRPVMSAAIPAYFSFIGFAMLAELAGEIDRPARTIPWALALSFACVLFFYVLVPVALVGVVPWNELRGTEASVSAAAARFLPAPWPAWISVGALLAAATSLNGILLSISRDIFALARDRIFPATLGRLHPRYVSPDVAVLSLTGLALVGVAVGTSIRNYAVVAVMAIMVSQILSALAVLLMPSRSPERFRQSAFRLRSGWRVFFSIGLVLYSLAFIALGMLQSAPSAGIFVLLVAVGTAYYVARRRTLRGQGLDLAGALRKDAALSTVD